MPKLWNAAFACMVLASAAVIAAMPVRAAYDEELAAKGEKVFAKCKACHQVGEGAKNRVGPALNGVYGAKVGHVDSFRYSNALKAKADEGVVWNDETLGAYLADPRGWAKGNRMSFAGLKDEGDRKAVIEYLKKHSQ